MKRKNNNNNENQNIKRNKICNNQKNKHHYVFPKDILYLIGMYLNKGNMDDIFGYVYINRQTLQIAKENTFSFIITNQKFSLLYKIQEKNKNLLEVISHSYADGSIELSCVLIQFKEYDNSNTNDFFIKKLIFKVEYPLNYVFQCHHRCCYYPKNISFFCHGYFNNKNCNLLLYGSFSIYFINNLPNKKIKYVRFKGFYNDKNLKYGNWKEFNCRGHLLSHGCYIDGKKEGVWKELILEDDNVKIHPEYASVLQGMYVNGEKEGDWEYINNTSNIGGQICYKNGKKEGNSRKWWNQNNQLCDQGFYVDNLKEGIWKKWYRIGQIFEEKRYNNGFLEGKCT